MLISTIIPVYNGEDNIENCIESIENNIYKDFEIIIVNDGSKDKTSEILNRLSSKYSNIKVIEISNGGVSNARNIGLSVATGTYITFVDSDDTVDERYFEKLINHMDKTDLVICNVNYIGTERKVEYLKKGEYGRYEIDIFNEKLMYFFMYELINAPCNKMYKKDIINKFKISFPLDLSLGEDLLFNLHYLQRCSNVMIIEDVLYNYFYVSESLSTKIRMDYLEIQDRLIEELKSYMVNMKCNNQYNLKRIDTYRINVFVSFVQDIFQKKVENLQRQKAFKQASRCVNKGEKLYLARVRGMQVKIILFALKQRNFKLLQVFFFVKEKILRPIIYRG